MNTLVTERPLQALVESDLASAFRSGMVPKSSGPARCAT